MSELDTGLDTFVDVHADELDTLAEQWRQVRRKADAAVPRLRQLSPATFG